MNDKETGRRFVEEAVTGRDGFVDELFTRDMTAWVRDRFDAFRRSFPTSGWSPSSVGSQ
jgi:hypothetical protein